MDIKEESSSGLVTRIATSPDQAPTSGKNLMLKRSKADQPEQFQDIQKDIKDKI